jgi:hypothetical protein
MAEFRINIEHSEDGCYQLKLQNVIGYAHGTDWYSNELLVEGPDVKLPVTLLIEEGKHAIGPDRNADGYFTPGYDINTRVNDAWGVRDILGSGFLISSGFTASMFKPRKEKFRVIPQEIPQTCAPKNLRSFEPGSPYLNRYELRPGYNVPICQNVENAEHLAKWTGINQFGTGHQPPQLHSEFERFLGEPLSARESWFPKFSARFDRNLGAAFVVNALDLREFYVVPKFNLVRDNWAVQALLTRSATQFVSPYFAMGAGFTRTNGGEPLHTGLATELGIKFRLRMEWPWRIIGAGYEFAGVRLGVRAIGFSSLSNLGIAIELGAGMW